MGGGVLVGAGFGVLVGMGVGLGVGVGGGGGVVAVGTGADAGALAGAGSDWVFATGAGSRASRPGWFTSVYSANAIAATAIPEATTATFVERGLSSIFLMKSESAM